MGDALPRYGDNLDEDGEPRRRSLTAERPAPLTRGRTENGDLSSHIASKELVRGGTSNETEGQE